MKKIIYVMAMIVLLTNAVSAVDCGSYFDDVDDIRAELYEDIKILRITADRLYSSCDELEAELDDLDNNDPLTEVDYELETFVQRAGDAFSDMNEVSDLLGDYDDEISDARKDIPSECYDAYLNYDDDYDDIKRDFSDVKNQWDSFSENIDEVEVFENSPGSYEVSDAEPVVRQLTNAIEDFFEETESMSGPNNTINVGKSFSEADCIAMAEVTIQKEKAVWSNACEDKITIINNTCEECVCDDNSECDGLLAAEKEKFIICKTDVVVLQSKYDSLSFKLEDCNSSNVLVDEYMQKNTKLESENIRLRGLVTGLNSTVVDCNNRVCEECGPWFWVALALFILMIVGWILAM